MNEKKQKLPYWEWAHVKHAAQGNWEYIFSQLAHELAPALANVGKHVTCPIHGTSKRKGDGFRLFKDVNATGNAICNTCGKFSGIELLMELRGWEFKDAVQEIALLLGVEPSSYYYAKGYAKGTAPSVQPSRAVAAAERKQQFAQQQLVEQQQKQAQEAKAQQYIEQLWSQSVPLQPSHVAWQYLAQRGIAVGSEIELHSHVLPYYEDGEEVGHFDVLLAAVRGEAGQIVNVHRTYLTEYGRKAELSANKKLCYGGQNICQVGGAIKLGGAEKPTEEGIIFVSEGIETALSVTQYYKDAFGVHAPCWAAMSATFLPHIQVEAGIHTIVVFGDNDASGTGLQAAAMLCANQEGIRQMFTYLPKVVGQDWNDVLLEKGKFPTWEQIMTTVYG